MKRLSLFFIFLFMIINGAHAQSNWNIAFRGGLDLIPTSSNDNTHDGNLPKGFHAGFIGKLPVMKKISFQPEVQFTWMNYYSHTKVPEMRFIDGIADEYNIPPEQARQLINSYWQKTETTTSYLYFPLLMRYKYSGRFNITLGPEIGLIFRNKDKNHLKATVAGQQIENNTTVHGTDGIQDSNITLSAGAELRMNRITALELRYARSLSSLENSNSQSNSYYNYIQFSLIYRFLSF